MEVSDSFVCKEGQKLLDEVLIGSMLGSGLQVGSCLHRRVAGPYRLRQHQSICGPGNSVQTKLQ